MSRSPEKKKKVPGPSPYTADLTGGLPNDASRFLVFREDMDYLEGVIPGDAGFGSFIHPSESHALKPLQDLLVFQPAQLHCRGNWEHWDPNNPIRLGLSDRTATSAAEYAANPDSTPLHVSLANVQPRKAFRTSPNNHIGMRSWKQHCDDLWDLHRTMRSKGWASNYHLPPFLQLDTYGMRDVVAVALEPLMILGNPYRNKKHQFKGSTPFLHTSAERVPCENLTFGFPSAVEWKKAMFNKRLFVGLFHFEGHWTSFIFDRAENQLCQYDTLQPNRQKRFHAAGLAFREALSSAGLPYTVSTFGLPVTAQPEEWECGYLSMYVMLHNLRSMVGLSGEDLRGMRQPTAVKFDQTCTKSPKPFALRHRDWTLTPWETSQPFDLSHIKDYISIAILDELGIRDLTFMEGGAEVNMGTNDRRIIRQGAAGPLFSPSHLYTDLGGLQFICWRNRPYSHGYFEHRVVMPISRAHIYYRRDNGDVPQQPALFVTLPDDLITRYESLDCTVTDKATPSQKTPRASASVSTSPLSVKDQTPKARSRTGNKSDAEKVALMKKKLENLPAIPRHLQSLAQRDSLVQLMKDISISDLVRLSEQVGVTLSPEAREQDTHRPGFEDWLVTETPQETTPRAGLRRSARLNPDLRAETSSPLSSLGSCLPTPYDMMDIDSLPLMGIAGMPLIPGARLLPIEGDRVSSSRESFDQVPLSAGAQRMTREARDRLGLRPIQDRATQYLPTTGTWASYVPQGMVAESQWADMIREVSWSLRRDQIEQGLTRAQRAEARNKRRE
ncbi:hypothetical protein BGZ61DRAFT_488258 [Ilyonectria robusta]|uniref:uncharacterized protein n=1 Tax=Ilyonectria robusta TaxID=1079257 RepID=UPI001E8EEB1A|nr:uncharacterized protein BGZ61DRAFT_488258 [Ilyonectria robusta]KAH8646450.1 hypothetical protein BGZ61DRAFT_488258 [Ilyonectria robusta]